MRYILKISCHRVILTIACFFLTLSMLGQTQNVNTKNVSISTIGDVLIIYYELENVGKTDFFDVTVSVRTKQGGLITPKSLEGDFSRVSKKGPKKIIWNVYNDVESINIDKCFVIAKPIIKQKNNQAKKQSSVTRAIKNILRGGYFDSSFGIKPSWTLSMIDINSPYAINQGYYLENTNSANIEYTHLIAAPLGFGLFRKTEISSSFNFQIELNYARRGFNELISSEFNVGNNILQADYKKFRIDYVQIPISFIISNENKTHNDLSSYLSMGGYFGYAFNGSIEVNNMKYDIFSDFKTNNFDLPINREDYGFLISYGMKDTNDTALDILFYKSFPSVNINNQSYWMINNTLHEEEIGYWGIVFSFLIKLNDR